MRLLLAVCIGLSLLLAGCETRPAPTEPTQPPVPPAAAPAPVAAPVAVARPDTIDYAADQSRGPAGYRRQRPDTLLRLGSHHYWLHLSQAADSTKPIDFAPATLVTKLYAAPSDTAWHAHRVRGYDGTYTFTLRDSAQQRVIFTKKLHKRDFWRTDKGEVLVLSEPEQPRYLGYSSGLGVLVFTMYFGLPYSDVIDRTTLLLDARTGQVRGTYGIGSASFEAIDCDPQPAPDGQAVLTCAGELLRAGRPPLSLKRPHAELRAARFLTDTTLLVVYEFGDYRPATYEAEPASEEGPSPVPDAVLTALLAAHPMREFTTSPAQRRLPNAFVLSTSGRQLTRFRFDGWQPDMGYSMARRFVPATGTYYLLNSNAEGQHRSLVLLRNARPDSVLQLPLASLLPYKAPQHPAETKFVLNNTSNDYFFYADSAHPRRIRYQRRPAVER